VADQQLRMFVTDYDRLAEARDRAAYRALGAITRAIVLCKHNDLKGALAVLTEARDLYEARDRELQTLKVRKGGNRAN
jgi:hypothetical protein